MNRTLEPSVDRIALVRAAIKAEFAAAKRRRDQRRARLAAIGAVLAPAAFLVAGTALCAILFVPH